MIEHAAVILKPHLMGCRFCRQKSVIGEEPLVEEAADSVASSPRSASGASEVSAVVSSAETAEPVDLEQPLIFDQPAFVTIVGGPATLTRLEPTTADWDNRGFRFYVVWVLPLAPQPRQFSGIHWGLDVTPYAALLALNRGRFHGIRWRRVRNQIQGRNLYVAEADGHGAPGPPVRHFRWQRQ